MPIRFASRRVLKPLLYTSVLVTAGGGFLAFYSPASGQRGRSIPDRPVARSPGELRFPKLKSREEHISDLRRSGAVDGAAEFGATQSRRTAIVSRQSSRDDDTSDSGIYDLLIIGGGATGTGIALDAVTRGLKVALVERDDFSSGTSSKSTKLVHGGVRYLEKAVWNLDYNQYKLVKEALRERKYFLDIAPHLSSWLPTILPIRRWYEAPYLWAGTKLYDLLAGSEGPKGSYYLSKSGTMAAFPTLDGTKIVGSLVYHDGQHNDSRMNVSLAVTAALYGATVVNHLKVTALEKDNSGKVCGAQVQDQAGPGDEFLVRAKGIINATGPFSDSIRQMDEPTKPGIVAPSSGVHIVLPSWLGPENMGIIDPSSDGRVIFLLPWEGKFIAGTTDMSCEVGENPIPAEQEVGWILREVGRFMDPGLSLQRSDVLAAWSGIRPLVHDPNAKHTESLVRNHLVTVSESGLLTCAGGKWTTYREMSEDAVNKAVEVFGLKPRNDKLLPNISGFGQEEGRRANGSCQTRSLQLVGAHGFSDALPLDLMKHYGMDEDVARYLARSYGDRAWEVARLSSESEPSARRKRIVPSYPYLDAEVRYAVRNEYALTSADFLARRTRLAFLDSQAALEALPHVIELMGEELRWSKAKKDAEWKQTIRFLASMGLPESMLGVTKEQVVSGRASAELRTGKRDRRTANDSWQTQPGPSGPAIEFPANSY